MRYTINPHAELGRRFGLCLGLVLALFWAACEAPPAEKPQDPNIVARVGDKEIGIERLKRALDRLYPDVDERPEGVERKVLQRLIESELLIIEARTQNLDRDWRVQNAVQQKAQELILEELFRRGILEAAEGVDEAEARDYFKRYHIGEERRLRRILVDSPETVGMVFSQLKGGEDFAVLAQEISHDPRTAGQGGDLGWKSRLGFRSHVLRRQIFGAQVGDLIGPLQEPDGFSVIQVVDIRQVPFDSSAAAVRLAVVEQKQTLTTLKFLEDLADRGQVREEADNLHLLLRRLSEAGMEMPELREDEGARVLLRIDDMDWTLGHFMNAMRSERDPAEIKSAEDLRLYARRLFALKILLPRRAAELGIDQTEYVRQGRERVERAELMERLRALEVEERIDIEEDEVRAYYEANREVYIRPERISILEILVDTRDQAEELLVEIEKGGDLDQLARRYSKRSTRVRRAGGRMQLMRPDKYGRVGWEAKDAQVGEVVGPVKSNQGFSIIKVLKKIPAYQQTFAEDKIRAEGHLRQELIQEGLDELLQRLTERYADRIEVYQDRLQALAG
ncbi:MAG: hypothetical protein GKR89_05555 [Candidatus Latescibacteria bacterium]|nr:hypothetical protein [Candidatus Latescibacterota bacterium]